MAACRMGRFLAVFGRISRIASEQRLELALMGADLGLWDWNLETREVVINDRWAEMLGYTLDETQPHYDGWARLVHPEDLPQVMAALRGHLQGALPFYEIEHRLRTKTGEWKWVLSRGKVLERDGKGRPVRAAGTHMDISVRKELEARLWMEHDQLCHAQRLTIAGELATMMAHELNQPLSGIANYVGAAILGFPGVWRTEPELRETLDEILRLSNRASDVIRGIRDLVRKQTSEPEAVCLPTILGEIFSLIRHDLVRRQIAPELQIPPDLPRVWGHKLQLQQMLLNLILNAVDAMQERDKGERRLTVSAEVNHDRELTLRISDTGPGIAPEIIARLFQPFVTTKRDGIGLGLSLCRTIVDAHGGNISVESRPGMGATFTVTLPVGEDVTRHAN
jgi:PAS domain S-box-containing protein